MSLLPKHLQWRPVAGLVLTLSSTSALAEPINFNIPVQALSDSIKQFAQATGLSIAVDSSLISGKTAPALQGNFEPADALKQLLTGSGLVSTLQGNNVLITKQSGDTNLKEVAVVSNAPSEPNVVEGSAEAGYKVDTAKIVGPWGSKNLLDTPYSMTIVSKDLIENTVSGNADNIYKISPTVQFNSLSNVNDAPTVTIRGFSVGNHMIEGMRYDNSFGPNIEDIERVEVLTGLSGFMYGSGNVGGTINYQLKRPTAKPLYDLTFGNYGGGQYFGHADLGGPIDSDGKFGYRFNVAGQDGSTNIQDQNLKRVLFSGALDWHITDKLLAQVNAFESNYKLDGRQSTWSFANGLSGIPATPDNSRLWASKNSFNQIDSTGVGAKISYDINDIFKFRTAYNFQNDDRRSAFSPNTITGIDTYNILTLALRQNFVSNSGYAYLDAKFDTWDIAHKLTLGVNGFTTAFSPYSFSGSTVTGIQSYTNLNLTDPNSANVSLANFNLNNGVKVTTSRTANTNFLIGDDIKFNDQWSALVGVNYVNVGAQNYNTSGLLTTSYDKSAATPSGSLLFKPIPGLTTYASYIESLEQGQIVGPTYKNAGAVLAPLTSRQYEIGAKTELGKTLLTLALFEIDKGNQYSSDNTSTGTYVQDGRQVHQGIEFTTTGKVTDDLTLFGGVTFMNLKVEKTSDPTMVGKKPVDATEEMAKLYAEYNLPFLRGLTLTGGVYYTGKIYADTANTYALPDYTIADIGARYSMKMYNTQTTYRLNITNLTNQNYWASSSFLGAPQAVSFSADIKY